MPSMTALRQHRGLIVIAVTSLVLLGISRYAAFLWVRPYILLLFLTSLENIVCGTICASAAIVAALMPERRFTGLFWGTTFGMAVVLANWLADSLRLPDPARPHLWYLAETLSVFVVAQGLRFLLGYRLTKESIAFSHRTGQFRLPDVLE